MRNFSAMLKADLQRYVVAPDSYIRKPRDLTLSFHHGLQRVAKTTYSPAYPFSTIRGEFASVQVIELRFRCRGLSSDKRTLPRAESRYILCGNRRTAIKVASCLFEPERNGNEVFSVFRARSVAQISTYRGKVSGTDARWLLFRRLAMISGSHDLTVLDQASRILAEAKSLDDIKTIRDKAEAARAYVKAAKLGLELQNRAAEVKLRAERKAGSLLRSLKLRGGDRKSKGHAAPLKLDDLGISRDQSKRWQHIACVSDAEFSKYLKSMIDHGREITSAGLLRIAGKGRRAPRPCQSTSSSDVAEVPDANRAAEELFEELTNHCRLLGNVLRPVYEGAGPELKRGEKRVVGRLIGEISTLVAQLRKTWPHSSDNR